MSAAKPALKAEVLRLRIDERLSNRDIEALTGASRGSVSAWLRDHPLTEEERRQKIREKRTASANPTRSDPSKYAKMLQPGMSSLQKAKVAEAAVLFRFALMGFSPFGSPFDGDKADWVVDVRGKLLKVQVRLCRLGKHGSPFISLRRVTADKRSVRFQPGDFDFIVGYDLHSDTAFVYGEAEVAGLSTAKSVTESAKEAFAKMT